MGRQWAKVPFIIATVVLATCAPAATTAAATTAATTVAATVAATMAASSEAARATATGAFPVTVTSADGRVTIPERPERILCLSASATQMLYAIGAGAQVVGVDEYSTYPADAPRTKFTGAETSAEDYLPLKPDLVIFAYQSGTVIQQLKLLGVPSLLLPPATGFSDVDGQLAELGAATGHPVAAASVEKSLQADTASAVAKVGTVARGDTYYIELDPTYYTATSKTFIGAELAVFGMKDIADAAGRTTAYPQISAEYVLKENPDYVFLADTVCCHADVANFSARPGFSKLQAVRDHHVIGVNDSVASQWGPHTIDTFVELLARTLRP
jgi:iron complex transport system substrate-binding protein